MLTNVHVKSYLCPILIKIGTSRQTKKTKQNKTKQNSVVRIRAVWGGQTDGHGEANSRF